MLDVGEAMISCWLYQQVEQFKRERGAMAVKDIETLEQSMLAALDRMAIDHPELAARILAHCPPEQRLEGLKPADRLRGLSPEELDELRRLLH